MSDSFRIKASVFMKGLLNPWLTWFTHKHGFSQYWNTAVCCGETQQFFSIGLRSAASNQTKKRTLVKHAYGVTPVYELEISLSLSLSLRPDPPPLGMGIIKVLT